MFKAKISITLRQSILDPQGKAIHHALESMEMNDVSEVRIGKFVEMTLNSSTKEQAEQTVEQACKKLLANPVMEDFHFVVTQI
ncbi:MAG: phosphoribosylformylglycinamidine synthase subunit PurS [Ignavibacteriae bacterium]|nr:phosphoribosylformylglycinamidine synthase subunit PurS [Ignavibacteriota bacterium]